MTIYKPKLACSQCFFPLKKGVSYIPLFALTRVILAYPRMLSRVDKVGIFVSKKDAPAGASTVKVVFKNFV